MSTYATKLTRPPVKSITATTEDSRRTQSDNEKAKYEFRQLPNSDYFTLFDAAKDTFYVLKKTGSGVNQEVQCSCEYYKETGNTCEHLFAMRDLDMGEIDATEEMIIEFLRATNWHDDEDGRFVPSENDESVHVGNELTPRIPPEIGRSEYSENQPAEAVTPPPEGTPDPVEEIVEAEIVPPPPEQKKHTCKICGTPYDTADEMLNCIMRHNDDPTTTSVAPHVPVTALAAANTAPPMTMIQNLSPRLPEIGRIAVGEKGSSSGKGALPRSLDHFIFTVPEQDDTGRCLRDENMMKMFGGHCTEIPVRLLYNDLQLNFPTFYAKYARSGIKIRGDGVNWIKYAQDGTQEHIYDPEGAHGFLNDPDVKPHGILTVLLDKQDTVGGIFKFRTSSWNSINYILAGMALIERTCGMLTYIPLMLKCKQIEVTPKSLGRKTKITVVWLEFRGTIEALQDKASEVLRNMTAGQRDSMEQIEDAVRATIGTEETIDEQKDVAAEFYPGVD